MASLDVPSPYEGIIQEILIKEGQDIQIGQVIMVMSSDTPIPNEGPSKKKE